MVNNLYLLITGRDTALPPIFRFDRALRISLRFITALLPVLCSFGVANLITVLRYSGLAGFASLLFPIFLQLRSIHVCKRKFFVTQNHTVSDETSCESKDPKKYLKLKAKLRNLFSKDSKSVQKSYMTPYSLCVLSRPLSVEVMTVIGVSQFVLSVISLFMNVNRVSCELLVNELS